MLVFTLLIAAVAASPAKRAVPDYATAYAPIFHLYSAETYLPSDIGTQLVHTIPEVNYTQIPAPSPLTLDNLNQLTGTDVYLTSKEGIQALPSWFGGIKPDANGVVNGGYTTAIVTVEKPEVGAGIVDVFYFNFFAYNLGNSVEVFGVDFGEFGDHVGDWEHAMVRFLNGVPQAVWCSQHSNGQAFTYNAVQKQGQRPVLYIANGTHANYAISGEHDHTIPGLNLPGNGPITDYTSNGPLYDPVPSSYYYSFDNSTQVFTPYNSEPVNWLYFQGQWGDEQLPDDTPGQVDVFGQTKYSSGPNGPIFKNIGRHAVCLVEFPCIINPILLP